MKATIDSGALRLQAESADEDEQIFKWWEDYLAGRSAITIAIKDGAYMDSEPSWEQQPPRMN